MWPYLKTDFLFKAIITFYNLVVSKYYNAVSKQYISILTQIHGQAKESSFFNLSLFS